MDKYQICIDFANDICDLLEIPIPTISFVPVNEMHTATQIAALTPAGVLIRDDLEISPLLFFALAHELRHAYQNKYGVKIEEYQESSDIDIGSYNLQLMEIDANAFASLLITSVTGIEPIFKDMPESIQKAIKARTNELKKYI